MQVGNLEVVELLDASGVFPEPAQVAFPQATQSDWAAARALDPTAFGAEGRWHLDFRCFALRRPNGQVTIVDLGVGHHGSPAATWAPTPGRLPQALDQAGITATDVDLVILTHLHSDHVGWTLAPGGIPMFPRAVYLAQRAELEWLEREGGPVRDDIVKPLQRTGQFDTVNGETRLHTSGQSHDATVTAIPTPGHTPGHQSVRIDTRDEHLIVTGDLLVHAVQLANPDVGYCHEADHQAAVASRNSVLKQARSDGALLATAHLRTPYLDPGHRHRPDESSGHM